MKVDKAIRDRYGASNKMTQITLQVQDASRDDIKKEGIARITREDMRKLGLSEGDVLEIVGNKTTSAIAFRSEDKDRGLIRIDGAIRKNAGVSVNENVIVRKAKVTDALDIVLAPVDMRLNVDQDFTSFVKNKLLESPRTFVEGDTTIVVMLSRDIPFLVHKTRPNGIVRVTLNTSLQILNEPASEGEIAKLPRTTFMDIGGLYKEVQYLREIVELPLRYPELFLRLGIEPSKGILLYGPPGCGKTLLARALANESEVNFFSINGPEIMSKFHGESEARLRQIFEQAQKNAPSIIFIDHIDSITQKRKGEQDTLEHKIVAQLLGLMDGMATRRNVVVIGATDRIDLIDPALRRPGRFETEIEIGMPDKQARLEILQGCVSRMPLSPDTNLEKLAEMTDSYTGAELIAFCREAAMKALRRYLPEMNLEDKHISQGTLEKIEIRMEDFLKAYEKIVPTTRRH